MLDRTQSVGYNNPVDQSESAGGLVGFFPGQLPKWPNGADCKSAVFDFGGSNPSLPTDYLATCPCGAAVAHSLGKTGVMGSIPITGSRGFCLISSFSSQSDLVFSSEISRISTLEVQVALICRLLNRSSLPELVRQKVGCKSMSAGSYRQN